MSLGHSNISLSLNLNRSLSQILSMKVHGPDFFKQITQRYDVITRSGRLPSLILLRLLENAGGITKLTNINVNNIKKIFNTGIRQYINLYIPILFKQNVAVPYTYFNDSLSPDIHLSEQVNIRTDPAKDTKHVVIPRLMRYLQRIDDQDSGYGFQTVSTKTLATTKLVRTLPERIVSQREIRNNTITLSKDWHLGSDIRVMRDKDDYFVDAGIDKTQSSGMQIEKAGNFSELQHLKMPDAPRSDKYTDNVDAGISGAGVSENSKVRGIILHPLTQAEEKNPEVDTVMTHIQKRNKQVYEKHDFFHRRTTDRHLVTEKNNIANKLISNTHIARSRMTKMEAEADEVMDIPNEFSLQKVPKLLFDQDSVSLQHARHSQESMIAPSNLPSNNIVRKSSNLVFRKPVVHSVEKDLENTGEPDIIRTERPKINTENENIIGTNIKTRGSIDDISIIADRVYRLLETRISIEKERRGLR